jgi:hypothetical protein
VSSVLREHLAQSSIQPVKITLPRLSSVREHVLKEFNPPYGTHNSPSVSYRRKPPPEYDVHGFSTEGLAAGSRSKSRSRSDSDSTMGVGEVTVDIPLTPVNSNGLVMTRQLDSAQSGDYLHKPAFREKTVEKDSRWRPNGGRRKTQEKSESNARQSHHGEEEITTQMGRFYNKVLNFSIVTRYFLYVLPLALIIATLIIIGATAAKNAKVDTVPIVWFFTWIEIVWLSLWVSKLFAKCLPFIFQFLCGIISSGTRKYALVIKALEIQLSLAGWALASLATFKPVRIVSKNDWKTLTCPSS